MRRSGRPRGDAEKGALAAALVEREGIQGGPEVGDADKGVLAAALVQLSTTRPT